MTIKLITKRINAFQVEVSLIFIRVAKANFNLRSCEIITNRFGETAVIFDFGNSDMDRITSRWYNFFTDIRFDSEPLTLNNTSKIRVFYWNNYVAITSSEIECFRQEFNNTRLGTNSSIGDISLNCYGNKEPRQGGNGGVIGISNP
jgi:hypothetical protein